MKLLTTDQYKLNKAKDYGYYTVGLNLSPATEAALVTGRNDLPTMCAKAGECASVCLVKSSMNKFPQNAIARAARTEFYIDQQHLFIEQLQTELIRAAIKADKMGLKFAYRPNLLSDQPKLADKLTTKLGYQAYDYTKIPKPWLRIKNNYHLTFSYSEKTTPADIEGLHTHGINPAVVFTTTKGDDLPRFATLENIEFPVIDGDKHDLRFLDPKRVIVGLRFKGSRTGMDDAVAKGFVLPC